MRGGSLLSRFEAADLERDHRLALRHVAGHLHKATSLRNAFHIEHNDARMLIIREGGEDVGLVDVHLVAETDELREAKTFAPRPIKIGRASCRERAKISVGAES